MKKIFILLSLLLISVMSASPMTNKRVKKEVVPFTIPEHIKKKHVNKSKLALESDLSKKGVK